MPVTDEQAKWFAETFRRMSENVSVAVLGKEQTVRLALTCLLAEGHLLVEDNPGTGKTMLARAIAATVRGTNNRIQFTPDLLPSDVTGVSIYNQRVLGFEFHPGPIFATIVLADEINRASPKTQSSLLEVMDEGHVTVDGVKHEVGAPFMVIATQNPIEQAGTYRLPEAQLDRFLMKIAIGYPDRESMVELLAESAMRDRVSQVPSLVSSDIVQQMCALADQVTVDRSLLEYVARVAEETRRHPQVRLGLSVRGALAFTRAAKTWALADARNYVIPDDFKDLALPVLGHRLLLQAEAEFGGATASQVIERIFNDVPPPTDRGALHRRR